MGGLLTELLERALGILRAALEVATGKRVRRRDSGSLIRLYLLHILEF